MKKARVNRKTLKEKIEEVKAAADLEGYYRGLRQARSEFGPQLHLNAALNDFVRSIEAWPLIDDGVVFIIGTDLKHGAQISIPVRTVRAIAGELRRLGYSARLV